MGLISQVEKCTECLFKKDNSTGKLLFYWMFSLVSFGISLKGSFMVES